MYSVFLQYPPCVFVIVFGHVSSVVGLMQVLYWLVCALHCVGRFSHPLCPSHPL